MDSHDALRIGFEFQSTPLMRGATDLPSVVRSPVTLFQSTPLMRGATSQLYRREHVAFQVSIHAPHARGDMGAGAGDSPDLVSIHAPHARGDSP